MGFRKTVEPEITLALDLMGSDLAPAAEIRGAYLAWKKQRNLRYIMVGDKVKIMPIIDSMPKLKEISTVIHTDIVVSQHDKPSNALRYGRESSMALAIKEVAAGNADGVVSAGNTGALMVLSSHILKNIEGIDRPAIAGIFPSKNDDRVVLDIGANVECRAKNLCEFAMMGAAFARGVLGIKNPRVGLLNIGTEEMKGTDVIKEAAAHLRHSEYPINYYGFVEGNDIARGTVDVVVADGFTGNIALKTTEGTVKMYTYFLRDAVKSSLLARIGYLFVKPALSGVFKRLNPRLYNSAYFLGLNGLVIKSHGSTDERGFANSILYARRAAANKTNDILIDLIKRSDPLIEEEGSDIQANNVIDLDQGLS